MSGTEAELENRFREATVRVKALAERPDNATLLRLYALFKQGEEGPVAEARPGGFDFVAQAKWDARDQVRALEPRAAREAYIALVDSLTGAA
jgi:acyl-CoA-binding protein